MLGHNDRLMKHIPSYSMLINMLFFRTETILLLQGILVRMAVHSDGTVLFCGMTIQDPISTPNTI